MEKESMKEKMQEAKKIYFMTEMRSFMRKLQGLTDDDFKKPVPKIKEKILNSKENDPLEMFERIFQEIASEWEASSPLPVHNVLHHFIVSGIVLTSLRNCGYQITDKDIEEAMMRGEKFAGGSCGFAGTCGGAYSVGIILSIVKKINPLYDNERSEIMEYVAETLKEIAKYPRRCCKRSSYIALQRITKYLNKNGYDKLPYKEEIKCNWSKQNKMCLGTKCLYFKQEDEK